MIRIAKPSEARLVQGVLVAAGTARNGGGASGDFGDSTVSPFRLGVYDVPQNNDVSLVEVLVQSKPSEIEVGEFTQEEPGTPRDSWQVAYMERYLNETGDTVIGDDMGLPGDDEPPTRLTFFMYYLDTNCPLLTPFGEIALPPRITLPDRLTNIIPFEEVD